MNAHNSAVGIAAIRDDGPSGLLQATPAEELSEAMMKRADPFGIMASLMHVASTWMLHPQEFSRAIAHLGQDLLKLQQHAAARAAGFPASDAIVPHSDDTRFVDPQWSAQPTWDIIKEFYLLLTRNWQDMCYAAPNLSDKEKSRAAFWLRVGLNALSPTNFFWTNPVAIQKFLDSQGESAVRGWQNFQRDQAAKDILMVEPDAFTVGQDLAVTPGQVVFRNALIELIQYKPTTPKVDATPIVIVTPWINKFYVLDLTPKKSMVKYLVDQGFTVFITSWKNPTPDMRAVSFDDYLLLGADAAVNTAREICRSEQVHLVGYCIGGTLVTTYMAWLNKHMAGHPLPVADWTLFTTLTDFSRPGDIEVFIDDATVDALTAQMDHEGVLEGKSMFTAFRLLRSNSLIWNYWVNSYLYGEPLPPFDVLYWNADATRMPAAMHSYYLREMYLSNNLMKRDKLQIAGEPIDLDRITQPLYAVTAEDDHIVPWKQSYRIHKFVNVKTPVRFVRSSSGHILGIVNPDVTPPKRSYRVADVERNEHWEHWLERTTDTPGTWWTDWLHWLRRNKTPSVSPPAAHKKYPSLCPAPGTYVLEK
jgi:polyhydroxyalkanoate synthase